MYEKILLQIFASFKSVKTTKKLRVKELRKELEKKIGENTPPASPSLNLPILIQNAPSTNRENLY